MLTRRARALLATGAVLGLLANALAAPAVAAKDPGGACPPAQVDCHVWDDKPGRPGGPGGGGDTGGGNGNGGSDPARKCTRDGTPVPCYDPLQGWFNQSDGCYYRLAEPPTTAPDGRQAYTMSCLNGTSTAWLDAPPGGFGAPPDPADLAAEALARLTLARPRLGIAPRSGKSGLVGLPVWLWIPPVAPYYVSPEEPLHASAEDRGLRVDIWASVEKVVWDMGNNDSMTCDNPGSAHTDQAGPSPTCGYPGYRRAGKYEVVVTTHWQVRWEASSGESDVLRPTRRSEVAEVTINELQVVTDR
ncbi:hypothetical protein [Plantactinospora sp. GCM10030261]|uniref:hypothetical protein n=1 Tax=Plantactinospora sp. GCM10030261 TaxID=3273420 RepID=UPI003605EDF8